MVVPLVSVETGTSKLFPYSGPHYTRPLLHPLSHCRGSSPTHFLSTSLLRPRQFSLTIPNSLHRPVRLPFLNRLSLLPPGPLPRPRSESTSRPELVSFTHTSSFVSPTFFRTIFLPTLGPLRVNSPRSTEPLPSTPEVDSSPPSPLPPSLPLLLGIEDTV